MDRNDSRQSPQTVAASVVAGRRVDTGRMLLIGAAFLSFLGSVYLFFTGQREEGIFVGIWVPSILSLGSFLSGPRHHE